MINRFYYIFILLISSQCVLSQRCNCPIDKGQIINGYINNENQQRYKATFFKENLDMLPVDLTILTDDEKAEVKSIVDGKVISIGENHDCLSILYNNNKIITYDLIDDITVKKGDNVIIGTIIGKVKSNNFPPKNYDKILGYKSHVYSVNISFYYFDNITNKLIHSPEESKIINCKTIICDKCQPKIYG